MRSPHACLSAVVTLFLFALGGCGAGSPGWQGSVTDSAGVTVVTNTGRGLWSRDEAWTVTPDLVIGNAEGDPDYQFGQIAGIDIDEAGRIYVLDQQAREVRVFDTEGKFLARFGRGGSGPGELGQAAGPLFVGPGDTIAVPDLAQQRVTRYDPTGEPVGSYQLPMSEGIAAKWMEAPNHDLIEQVMVVSLPGQPATEQRNLLLRRNSAGEVVDTIMELPFGKSIDFSGATPTVTLFEAEPTWAVGPDGRFYFGNSSEYRLEIYSKEGRLVRIVQKPFQAQPITEADQNQIRRILEDLWKRAGLPPQAIEMASKTVRFADTYPAYANFLPGLDGTLWVQGIRTPEEAAKQAGSFNIQDLGSANWEVFDRDGRLLGTVAMPPRFSPLLFHDQDIYGLQRDELDVQYVARMKVARPSLIIG